MKDEKYYGTNLQEVKLSPIKTNGFILDLGGGGEGIIGKLNGRQVVAIDMREEELQEIKNDALKIVMDARNLKFLPESFDICTSFFSLMYIPESDHVKVFKEVYQVLKSNRKFLIWDVEIPEKQKGYDIFVVQLKIFLPNEEIETGYGVKWDKQQNSEYFKKLAKETGFKLINEWHKDKIFYLEMVKNV